MPKYKPLKYREVLAILRNLGFQPSGRSTSGSHETWILSRGDNNYAVTVFFHGSNVEFKPKTLGSIIRQSGFTKDKFYRSLRK